MRDALALALFLGAAFLVLTRCAREGFAFAVKACDSINKESEVYLSSPRLQELCERAETINPSQVCLVDCDVSKLCGNPGVGYCRKPRTSPLLCQVTPEYYGVHPDNNDLPEVYRVLRGTCLHVSSESGVIDNRALREAVLRFPDEISVVGSSLGYTSSFKSSWSMTFTDARGHSGEHALPLIESGYIVEATKRARKLGVAARVPTALLHESSVSPGGRDTSFLTEPGPLRERLVRAKEHENQPSTLHVTARFSLPDTVSATIAGLTYSARVPGQSDTLSPVSGKKLSVRTEVWLMVALSPKTDGVLEVREVLRGSDGLTHVSRVRTGGSQRSGEFRYDGEPPRMWIGMRDAGLDLTLL